MWWSIKPPTMLLSGLGQKSTPNIINRAIAFYFGFLFRFQLSITLFYPTQLNKVNKSRDRSFEFLTELVRSPNIT